MIHQIKYFEQPGLQYDVFFPEEPAAFNSELGGMIQAIVGAFNGRIGILSQNSLDRSSPRILAATGFANPDFVRKATDRMAKAERLNEMNMPGAGKSRNIDFSEFSIADEDEGDEYQFLQVVMAYDRGEKFNLLIGRYQSLGPYTNKEKDEARSFFSIFSRYFITLWGRSASIEPFYKLISALDLWNTGVTLIDRQLRILFANPSANKILDEADGLKRIGGNLSASRLDDMARLQSAVLFSTQASLEDGVIISQPKIPVMAIARNRRRRPLIVSVVSVNATMRDSNGSAAVVYIIDPDRDMRESTEAICQTYGLTKVEAQLVGNLVAGMTLLQAAQKMRIQPHTARSYLKQVFQKTMTNRQADLVRVMLASTLPHANKVDLSII